MAHAALKVIRPVIRLSSTISPRTVGRLAFRLFCTPVGHAKIHDGNPKIKAAKALFARGEQRMVAYARGVVRVVSVNPEQPSRGTVLLLHGWTGQGLFMAGFAEALLAKGYRVIAMDLPAHGGSSGKQLTFPLAIEAVTAVVRGEGELAGIVAHSFGGSIALAAVAGGVAGFDPIVAKRIVTIAAPMGMQGYGRQFAAALGLTRRSHAAFEDEVMVLTGRPMASFSGPEYLRRFYGPTLVMHAPDDKEIPFSDAEALASAGAHVELLPIPGLGHRRILMSQKVHEHAAEFISRSGPD